MKRSLFLFIALALSAAGCSNKDKVKDLVANGSATIEIETDVNLSTGESVSVPCTALFVVWSADDGRNYNIDVSDLGEGYNYDSTTQKSYKYVDLGQGQIFHSSLPAGRYFLWVIVNVDNHNSPYYMCRTSTYFIVKSAEDLELKKVFSPGVVPRTYQDW